MLERRSRRLLAWYPAVYRAANDEEMIGVALAHTSMRQLLTRIMNAWAPRLSR